MNKEFIDWLESEIQYLKDIKYASLVEFGIQKKLELVIKKYDELSKPVVIPKYVAEYLDWFKCDFGHHIECDVDLIVSLVQVSHGFLGRKEVKGWLNTTGNAQKLIDAYRWGYEVEEEQKYCVNDGNNTLLCKWKSPDGWKVISTVESENHDLPFEELDFRLTEHEIKDFDPRYWPFRKPIDKTVNE